MARTDCCAAIHRRGEGALLVGVGNNGDEETASVKRGRTGAADAC